MPTLPHRYNCHRHKQRRIQGGGGKWGDALSPLVGESWRKFQSQLNKKRKSAWPKIHFCIHPWLQSYTGLWYSQWPFCPPPPQPSRLSVFPRTLVNLLYFHSFSLDNIDTQRLQWPFSNGLWSFIGTQCIVTAITRHINMTCQWWNNTNWFILNRMSHIPRTKPRTHDFLSREKCVNK